MPKKQALPLEGLASSIRQPHLAHDIHFAVAILEILIDTSAPAGGFARIGAQFYILAIE
jgi:hypothetical protein